MDRPGGRDSDGWEPGAPQQRAWTQGPWHEGQADRRAGQQGAAWPGMWDPGSGDFDGGSLGAWTVSSVAVHELQRRIARFLVVTGLAAMALFAGVIVLAVAVYPHGGTLAALGVLLGVPALLVALTLTVAI